MKVLIPVATALVVFPGAVSAQININLDANGRPVMRANVGVWSVSAKLGDRGVDLRVDDVPVARRPAEPTTTRRRTSTSTPTGTTSRPSAPVGRRTAGARASASGILNTADDYLGTKYVWGGETPRGFDCSGFVQYVFGQHGIDLPRTSRQQVHVGQRVSTSLGSLRAGDLMFFATNGVRIDHIAIYAGSNRMIHSSSSGGGVGYDNLSTRRGRWFVDHHVATRRVIDDGGLSLVGNFDAALRAFMSFDPPDRAPRR